MAAFFSRRIAGWLVVPAALAATALGLLLPAGCTQLTMSGVEYYKCGPDYYRTAYQGTPGLRHGAALGAERANDTSDWKRPS